MHILAQNNRRQNGQFVCCLSYNNYKGVSLKIMNSPTESLSTTLRLEGDGDEVDPWSIRLIDRSYIKALSIQVRSLLLKEENAGGKMEIGAFKDKFLKRLIYLQLDIGL